MKEIGRRLAKLETAHSMGAARRPTFAEEIAAVAEMTRILEFYTKEKIAGDVNGIVARDLPELIAMCGRITAERRA